MHPFTDTLRGIRNGRVVDACTEELAEVVRAVLATNKAGTFTLTLSIKPQGKGDNAVIIGAKTASKVPQAALPDALFFADHDGDLMRDDPTQNRLFADAAKPKGGELMDSETGEIIPARQEA